MITRVLTRGRRRDFPGGPVAKNLPLNTGDGARSLVGELRSHPHATGHLSPHTSTAEATLSGAPMPPEREVCMLQLRLDANKYILKKKKRGRGQFDCRRDDMMMET